MQDDLQVKCWPLFSQSCKDFRAVLFCLDTFKCHFIFTAWEIIMLMRKILTVC